MALPDVKIKTGIKNVATAGTALALSSTNNFCESIIVTALADNTGAMTVGGADIVGTTVAARNGHPLAASEGVTFQAPGADAAGTKFVGSRRMINIKDIYIDCLTGNTDGVSWVATE